MLRLPLVVRAQDVSSAILVITLAAASIQDLKGRMIDDRLWIFACVTGIALNGYCLWSGILAPSELASQLLGFAPLGLLLLVSWKLRLMGEADVLAYLTIEVVQPVANGLLIPPALSSFIYSKASLVLIPLGQLTVNLYRVWRDPSLLEGFDEPLHRKIMALALLSPRPSLGAVPAEIRKSGRRRFDFSRLLAPLEPTEPKEECKWYVPAYPLLPLILVGYVLSVMVGDPVALLYRRFGS